MKYLKFKSYGKVYDDCCFQISHYINNNNLAVMIYSKSQGPFVSLTVNIDDLDECYAVIDIKNCEFAEELIDHYGLGKITGYTHYDYVDYPIYKLNVDKMLEYGIEID